MTGFDPATVRGRFPALAEGLALLDGPGGTQMPFDVIDAVQGVMRTAVANRKGRYEASRRAEVIVDEARAAVADLVGGQAEGVVQGASMTAVTYGIANALAKTWAPGDEVVVTRLDHDANVRPWVQAAARSGATVRWIDVDPATCMLRDPLDAVGARTRLVAVTGSSNAVGTRPDVRELADAAHAAGALTFVDGVHLTPHAPVDVRELGADFYALSAYKFCGPHVGFVVADPLTLRPLTPDKLEPAPDTVPDKFENGTPAFEMLAGVTAAVDFLAGLAPPGGTRRQRLRSAMEAIERYEGELFDQILEGLEKIDGVTTYGAAVRRTPTVGFRLQGRSPGEVAEGLARRGVCVWDGEYYAREFMRTMGLLESGGLVRVGVSLYNSPDDVRRLLDGVRELASGEP